MRRVTRTGICVLALAGVCWAQGQTHTAKIVLEDGTPFPSTPEIIVGLNRQFTAACVLEVFGSGTVQYAVRNQANTNCRGLECLDTAGEDSCPVTIRLAGYRTANVTLHQGAVVVLKRLGDHEGSTVSITALNAPKEARKAYESGVAAMARKKWGAAQKDFERAVAEYPQYAPAWSDLGEVLVQESKPLEARAACEHALEADPKYLRPYLQLARLALSEGRTEDAAHITTRALALNPVEFPGLYFYDAVADLKLQRLDDAERSVRRAIELDSNHEIPLAQSLLGTLLAAKGDRAGAIEHYRKYLQISPDASDASTVRRRIEELEAAAQK
jgi:tetratricopeptide (TPR) repeat protein